MAVQIECCIIQHFIRVYNVKKIFDKMTTFFENDNLTHLDIHNGPFQNYCIKPEGIIHKYTDRSKAVLLLWFIYVISVLFLLCFCVRLFINALWSPVGKEQTSWLSFVMSNCEIVTFPLISWVRCGA